jgi:hypothetical protein
MKQVLQEENPARVVSEVGSSSTVGDKPVSVIVAPLRRSCESSFGDFMQT